ncbi:unnamed protein product [Ixodes persulcatus]
MLVMLGNKLVNLVELIIVVIKLVLLGAPTPRSLEIAELTLLGARAPRSA